MPPAAQRTQIRALFGAPFRDGNFRRLMIFLASWNFSANLASPFFVVYMLKTVGYSMGTIIVLTTASQLSNLAALSLWGTLIDRFSNKAVLGIAAPLFLMCTLAWSFTGLGWIQPAVFFVLLGIHVLMGVATAGVALASGNIAMKLSPPGQATAYLATNSVVSAVFAAAAPILGGLLADFFAARDLSFGFTWKGTANAVSLQVLDFHAWTFLFGLSAMIGLFSLHRLSFIEETAGTTDPLQVRHLLMEARRSVNGISSAAGLLRVVRVPSWLMRPREAKVPRL
jgi:MFS family permease